MGRGELTHDTDAGGQWRFPGIGCFAQEFPRVGGGPGIHGQHQAAQIRYRFFKRIGNHQLKKRTRQAGVIRRSARGRTDQAVDSLPLVGFLADFVAGAIRDQGESHRAVGIGGNVHPLPSALSASGRPPSRVAPLGCSQKTVEGYRIRKLGIPDEIPEGFHGIDGDILLFFKYADPADTQRHAGFSQPAVGTAQGIQQAPRADFGAYPRVSGADQQGRRPDFSFCPPALRHILVADTGVFQQPVGQRSGKGARQQIAYRTQSHDNGAAWLLPRSGVKKTAASSGCPG